MAGLHSIPSVVQLPGGVKLHGLAFKVVEYDDAGRPLRFELLPPDQQDATGPGIWRLFAHKVAIRQPVPEGQR